MKKFRLKLIIIILIVIVSLILLLLNKESISNNKIGKLNERYILNMNNISLTDIPKENLDEIINDAPLMDDIESAVTSPGDIFVNKTDNWAVMPLGFNAGNATVEIMNIGSKDLVIDENFVSYLGIDEENTGIKSSVDFSGEKIIKPREVVLVQVKNGVGANYLKIGYTNQPINWAMYLVENDYISVVNENQFSDFDNQGKENMKLTASILPSFFNKINISTVYSRKNYNGETDIHFTKNEKKEYLNSSIASLTVEIFNKTEEKLEVDSISYIYKKFDTVINTENINNSFDIISLDCKFIEIPFKYYGSNIKTTIVLNTNFGKIVIEEPELLFAVIDNCF